MATTTAIAVLPETALVGQSVAITVTVADVGTPLGIPSGSVKITDGARVLGSGKLGSDGTFTCDAAFTAAGPQTIVAAYTPPTGAIPTPATYIASSRKRDADRLPEPVNHDAGRGHVRDGQHGHDHPDGHGHGQHGHGRRTTGSVTFLEGKTLIGASILGAGGKATLKVAASKVAGQSVTAVYGGDANFAGGSGGLTLAAGLAPTTTTVGSSASPLGPWQQATFTATVTAASTPTGTVQFLVDGVAYGSPLSLTGNEASVTLMAGLTPGRHTIAAAYSGDTSTAASGGSLTVVVAPASTVLTIAPLPSPAGIGQSVSFAVTVSSPYGTPAGTVALEQGRRGPEYRHSRRRHGHDPGVVSKHRGTDDHGHVQPAQGRGNLRCRQRHADRDGVPEGNLHGGHRLGRFGGLRAVGQVHGHRNGHRHANRLDHVHGRYKDPGHGNPRARRGHLHHLGSGCGRPLNHGRIPRQHNFQR